LEDYGSKTERQTVVSDFKCILASHGRSPSFPKSEPPYYADCSGEIRIFTAREYARGRRDRGDKSRREEKKSINRKDLSFLVDRRPFEFSASFSASSSECTHSRATSSVLAGGKNEFIWNTFFPSLRTFKWLVCALIGVALSGCSSSPTQSSAGNWNGPTVLASVQMQDMGAPGPKYKIINTEHYKIYSTIEDRPDILARTAQLMEGGFAIYRTFVPQVQPTTYPMQCWIFATRPQWMSFTQQHTGPDAGVYLKISRGGYTIHDWYVAYYIGDIATYSIAAHEGWHQFVNRHFKGRLPPFLEEGLATMFENVEWKGDLPRWNLSLNPQRALSLRKAMDAGELFPLDKLITLHAGQVVGLPEIKIEAFYAQNWSFARFLWEGENGKYRPALQKWLADTADGSVYDPTGSFKRSYLPWNPAGVRPMLEHYVGQDLSVIQQEYTKFMQKVAYEEMGSQFQL
jgi:hypothetical protein